jgi:hypothetical protein
MVNEEEGKNKMATLNRDGIEKARHHGLIQISNGDVEA